MEVRDVRGHARVALNGEWRARLLVNNEVDAKDARDLLVATELLDPLAKRRRALVLIVEARDARDIVRVESEAAFMCEGASRILSALDKCLCSPRRGWRDFDAVNVLGNGRRTVSAEDTADLAELSREREGDG